jgi:hypothetical protein
MPASHRGYLDDTLSDYRNLALTNAQIRQLLATEASKLNPQVSSDMLNQYFIEKDLFP